jgi:uncharacterized protein YegJ (DUF2314 family)
LSGFDDCEGIFVNIRKFFGIFLSVALILAACLTVARAEEPANLKFIPLNDPEMAAAAAKAQSSLDDFLAKFDSPPAGTEHYSVKIGIVDDGNGFALTGLKSVENVEYFWLGSLQRNKDSFRGTIANQPGIARNVREGQEITFSKSDIFDWMYIENGKMIGNATACPILLRGPRNELEWYRQNFGFEC